VDLHHLYELSVQHGGLDASTPGEQWQSLSGSLSKGKLSGEQMRMLYSQHLLGFAGAQSMLLKLDLGGCGLFVGGLAVFLGDPCCICSRVWPDVSTPGEQWASLSGSLSKGKLSGEQMRTLYSQHLLGFAGQLSCCLLGVC
jgi:hypothetical protein